MFGRSAGPVSWLAVFLGNPGPRYNGTRHNAGFLAAEALAKESGVAATRLRFQALTGRWELSDGTGVLVMKPQTYMNESGRAVGQAARFYKIPPEHVLVVSDDINLPCGRLRIRERGSAGGHNGLKSIIAHLGSEDFPRIRIGVGAPPHGGAEQIDWVLGVPRNADWDAFSGACTRAAKAVEDYIVLGPAKAMERYNRQE